MRQKFIHLGLQFVLVLLGGASVAFAGAAPETVPSGEYFAPITKLPPGDIRDVLKMLDTGLVADKELQRAKRVIQSEPPPADSDKATINDYHYKRYIAFVRLGKIREALVHAKKAAIEFKRDELGFQTDDLINFAVLLKSTGKSVEALNVLQDAKRLAEQSKSLTNIIAVDRQLVDNLSVMGDFEAAKLMLLDADSTLTLARRKMSSQGLAQQEWREANVELARANFYLHQGQWVESERSLHKALTMLVRAAKEADSAAKDYDELTDGLRGTAPRTISLTNLATKTVAAGNWLARVLLEQGKLMDAEWYARDALKVALKNFGRNSVPAAQSLTTLSRILSEQGRFKEAVVIARAALTANQEAGLTDEFGAVAFAQKYYAQALVAAGNYAQADQVMRALDTVVARDPELQKIISTTDLDRIQALQFLGQKEAARTMSARLLQETLQKDAKAVSKSVFPALFHAISLQEDRQWEAAYDLYKTSLPSLLAQLRSQVASDGNSIRYQQRVRYVFESYLALLARQKTEGRNLADVAEQAFAIADVAKSSGVQRALTASAARATIKDPRLATLARQEQDYQRRITSLSELLAGLLVAPPEQQLPAIQAKIRQDISEFKVTRERLKAEIDKSYPDYADMLEPKPASVANTQILMRDGEVLVAWYFGEKQSYVWVVRKHDPADFVTLPLNREQLKSTVQHLRESLDPGVSTIDDIPAFDVYASHALFQKILEPVYSRLTGKQVLIAIPHTELGQLPLATLLTSAFSLKSSSKIPFQGYSQAPWLIRDIAITQLPSVNALHALRKLPPADPHRKTFIGFGDPFFSREQQLAATRTSPSITKELTTRGMPLQLRNAAKPPGVSSTELALLPRLPDTKSEIQKVAEILGSDPNDIYLNQQASISNVMSTDLRNYKVVMFATHGLLPGELDGLSEPALALSSPDVTGSQDDGLLGMSRILNLKLNADWVVLSACNTASGDEAGAEAVSGLGRAFFYAGARALLVSNWPVDSQSARMLMTTMFQRYQQAGSIQPKSESLRLSMLDLMQTGPLNDKKSVAYFYAHPLFWAPFSVIGD